MPDNKKEKTVIESLKKSNIGLSITEIVSESGLSRSLVRIILAKLEGAEKVLVRQVGMAKLYYIKPEKNLNEK